MPKAFAKAEHGSVSPAGAIVPVTPSDATNFAMCRALLVGTAGAADIVDGSGTLRASVPLQQGYNPIHCQRVNLTNLTAANIWALY